MNEKLKEVRERINGNIGRILWYMVTIIGFLIIIWNSARTYAKVEWLTQQNESKISSVTNELKNYQIKLETEIVRATTKDTHYDEILKEIKAELGTIKSLLYDLKKRKD